METLRVVHKQSAPSPEAEALSLIRHNWSAAASDLDGRVEGERCSIDSCNTMPFVALKTKLGRRALCLAHFEQLRRLPSSAP